MEENMNLKQLIGNNAYWTINKELAKEIGLEATLILQHLIDLDENYFEGEFWQTGKSLQEATFLSKYLVAKAINLLENKGYISVENKVPNNSKTISKVYHFQILKENISKLFNSNQSKNLTSVSKKIKQTTVKEFYQVDKENKENKEKTNKVIDVPTDTDYYGKIFFKIVELYPANRIGNRQHGLKKFKTLSKEDAKLAAKNLKRYLKIAGSYVKSLLNYITESCYSEAWLSAEELNKNKKEQTNNKPDTKTISSEF